MSLNQSVLICDHVNPTLKEILEKNGLKVTYEPEITPEQHRKTHFYFFITSASAIIYTVLTQNAK